MTCDLVEEHVMFFIVRTSSNPLLFQCDANVVRIIGNNHLSFQNFLATLTRHSLEANMMLLHSYYLMKMFM